MTTNRRRKKRATKRLLAWRLQRELAKQQALCKRHAKERERLRRAERADAREAAYVARELAKTDKELMRENLERQASADLERTITEWGEQMSHDPYAQVGLQVHYGATFRYSAPDDYRIVMMPTGKAMAIAMEVFRERNRGRWF